MDSPAKFSLEKDGKKLYLCQKHLDQERRISDVGKIETLPEGSNIRCEECFVDAVNS